MELTRYQRGAYRVFGKAARRAAEHDPRLAGSLARAHVLIRPDAYLAATWLNMAAGALVGVAVLGAAAVVAASELVPVPRVVLVLLASLPLVLPLSIYALALLMPDARAYVRARRIEAQLPHALSYVSILAGAGVPAARIFDSLGRQDVYGEVAREAGLVGRDLEVLGKDLLTALQDATERSPSAKWAEFLQGATTAVTSGVDVKDYFLSKTEQFYAENRQAQEQFLENLGILAESFVTVVVAAPIFLILMLSVMVTPGTAGLGALGSGYVLVLLVMPLAQLGFAAAIRAATPEA